MANNHDFVDALTAFTQASNADRNQHQLQHAAPNAGFAAQQVDNAALLAAIQLGAGGGGVVHRPASAVVDSIPRFEGKLDDDAQSFVDHVTQVGATEARTDPHKLQVAARRLVGTALQWQIQTGHTHNTWVAWWLGINSQLFTSTFLG